MYRLSLVFFLLVVVTAPFAYGQDVYRAIDSGSVDLVDSLLRSDPQILNARNDNAMTPLNWAAYKGQTAIVKRLLDAGADFTIGDNENSQPMHNAAVAGHVDVIETLLAYGVDINSRDNNGMTALHFAVSYQRTEAAVLLIGKGADPNVGNNNGLTPIHYAAVRELPDLIDRLASAGGDINVQARSGDTPLFYATGRGNMEASNRLLELGANTELANEYGRTPLLNVARESGNVDMARLLVQHGADVNALDIFDDSPIVLAAWRGFAAIVNLLLDEGADVPADGHSGRQLVRYSAERGLDRLMKVLVDRGADLTVPNGMGGNLLHAAAIGGSPDIVSLLLDRGLPAKQPDIYGWTPLHYTAGKGRPEATGVLVDRGVDVNVRTLSGLTPFNLAESYHRTNVIELLRTHGADTSARRFPETSAPYFGMTTPGTSPELFAPDIVATNWGGHSSVAFSPDGSLALWSGYVMPSDSGYGRGELRYSRIVDGRWIVPQVPGFFLDGCYDDVPFFSPDGSKLYFISRRPLQPGGRLADENIWIMDLTGSDWGEPYPAPGEVNSIGMHWQFSVASSGTIYFGGSGPDQLGRGDIYKSTLVDGSYTTPVNLGNVINTEAGETCPFIAPDESYLIFTSDGHHGTAGEMEILVSWNDRETGWTTPVSTGLSGLCPMLSPGGDYLFYNGVTDDVHGVFWVRADFLEDLKPDNVRDRF